MRAAPVSPSHAARRHSAPFDSLASQSGTHPVLAYHLVVTPLVTSHPALKELER
ncbi:MAG: hypothetical protein QOJ19_1098 [Acidimicrobiia bacterium]|jgi:hypothetical protein|nr:hypothetical protein [Acidimicrobiia bacterium]